MLDPSSPFFVARPPGPGSKNEVALMRLRHALLSCELPPGSYFAEAGLDERYGLGRASVRVALVFLAAEGLVTSQARQGWQAAPVTGELIGNLLSARRHIEPLLLSDLPPGQMVEKLDALATFNAAIIDRRDAQSLVTARATDRQLMDLLAGNLGFFLGKWVSEIWNHSARVVHFLETPQAPHLVSDRRLLVDALLERDRRAATAQLLLDLERLQEFVSEALLRLRLPLAVEPKKGNRRQRVHRRPNTAANLPSAARPNETRGKTT